MKLRNPYNRFDLNIKKSYRVLDVGGGHNPHPRANVVVDKHVENLHRGHDLKVLENQEFVLADGENLPFEDNEFDYVICNHVLEHVDEPAHFLSELARVGKAGYVETPSLIGEYLIPKESHKWLILEIDDQIVLMDKEKVGFKLSHDFGNLFNDYLPRKSMPFKLFQRTQRSFLTINYEWKDNIAYQVNPEDKEFAKYFSEAWEEEHYSKLMPQRSKSQEIKATLDAFKNVVKVFTGPKAG